MSMWRCPHCGTPQAETARCWVCHRSSTTCSTCRNFRRSVAGRVGFCGLDRRRIPLSGAEHRGCWESRAAAAAADKPGPGSDSKPAHRDLDRRRDFIPVELMAASIMATVATASPARIPESVVERGATGSPLSADAREPWQDRRTLFGEADR